VIAQDTSINISGTVYEASNEVTIPGAHVFLNGTTIGAITSEDGTFSLKDVPQGVYQLVIKFLGFQDYVAQIDTDLFAGELEVYLDENVYEMNDITVVSDRKEWQERYEIFEDYFLGASENAEDTKILNPEVLNFEVDPETRILTAEGYESLKIKNEALGYEIEFYLEEFSFDYREATYSYFGYPVFSELESGRRRTNRRWTSNREETYNGSFQHFVRSLINGNYNEEGFVIKAEMRIEKEEISAKANTPSDSAFSVNVNFSGGARYLSRDTVTIGDIFYQKNENTYVLKFQNFLNVTYTKEQESYEYRKWVEGKFAEKNPSLTQLQNSLITLRDDSLLIDQSGFIHNPAGSFFGGYWAFERFSDLLPINYKPE
jgi:hypothetical protein